MKSKDVKQEKVDLKEFVVVVADKDKVPPAGKKDGANVKVTSYKDVTDPHIGPKTVIWDGIDI